MVGEKERKKEKKRNRIPYSKMKKPERGEGGEKVKYIGKEKREGVGLHYTPSLLLLVEGEKKTNEN